MTGRIDWSGFEAFVAGKPPEERYDYHDDRNCVVAQYLRSIDVEFERVGGDHVRMLPGEPDEHIPYDIQSAAVDLRRTMGGALARLRSERAADEEARS